MTEPPEPVLADPKHERLTKHDEALRKHYRWRTEQVHVGRPVVAVVTLLAFLVGLLVLAWVIVRVWPLP